MTDGRSGDGEAEPSNVDGEFGAAIDPPVGSVLDPVTNPVTLLCCEAIAWVDEDWPGWVRVRLVDADGRVWYFVDKVPILMDDGTRSGAPLPRPAFVRCNVVGKQEDQILLVSTAPDHVEAEDGTTWFRVRPDQLQPTSAT
ncbi:hypothetical protein [Micromonospora coxensis]|uniref:hypothetical protein n=1 Tax=Micromonospora coxensis TaxID=356852 RepID=UPI003432CA39